MSQTVVVLGSGYAGAGAVTRLEAILDGRAEADVTWVSDVGHHLVLHEAHRCIRDPGVGEKITIPVEEIKSPGTAFVRGRAVAIDTDDREIALADGRTVAYDYLLVAIGSRTAFFGIGGLREHALTLRSLDDALAIHDQLATAASVATADDPARVVIGGAGLSGIQTAGEIAAYRDDRGASLEITLVEGLDRILPDSDPQLQGALRKRLDEADVTVMTGEFVDEVDAEAVSVGDRGELPYDVLVWTGGITGRDVAKTTGVDTDERSDRVFAGRDFSTDDDRVFAVGDCALIDQPGDTDTHNPAPPTAQAAWQAASVAGGNLVRAVRGQPLEEWTYEDKGTVVSVGERAVAHDVAYSPLSTFGGTPARLLKKAIATRWIADVAGIGRAVRAWPDM